MKNKKTISMRKGFTKIPGFPNYAINREGTIYNIRTSYKLNHKDEDHWSGRVNLYRRANGESQRVTRNIASLIVKAFKSETMKTVEKRLMMAS